MKIIIAVGLALVVMNHSSNAQTQGYLKTKDLIYYGMLYGLEKLQPGEVVFQFNNGNKRVFTPYDAIEFGTAETGKKWVSRNYRGEPQFFEEMVDGKASLLYLNQEERFLLEKDSLLIELSAAEDSPDYFAEALKINLADCYLTEKTLKLAKYKKNNLRYFVSQYNDCVPKAFSKFRIGPVAGVRVYENVINSKYFPNVPEEYVTIAFGALVEIPLSATSQVLLATQPMVGIYNFTVHETQYNPQTAKRSENTHYLEHTDLDLPVMLKYRLPLRTAPYLQAGLAAQIGLSTKSYSITDQYGRVDNQDTLLKEDIYADSQALASFYFGPIVGAGVEVPITPYITTVWGINYSIYKAKVDTGDNRKSYPDIFLAITF